MNCDRARWEMAAGDRPADEVAAHLEACPACREHARRDAWLRGCLAERRYIAPPEDARDRAEAAVRRAIEGTKPAPGWVVWLGETAAHPATRWAVAAAVVLAVAAALAPRLAVAPAPSLVRATPSMPSNSMAIPGLPPGRFGDSLLVLFPERMTNLLGHEILLYPGERIEYGNGGVRTVGWEY